MTNEAFSRGKIDAQLRDQGWAVENPNAIRYEYVLQDGTKADYVLNDRHGRAVAVLEAKRTSVSLAEGEAQAVGYAKQLKVPFVFLANGEEVRVWEWEREAFPRVVKTIYRQDDLERRLATLTLRRDPRTIPIDNRIVERSYQHDCIDALTEQIHRGRRKMLVEMATGTGKTRTAAALIKRLFEANAVTRVLFIVDRITLQSDRRRVRGISSRLSELRAPEWPALPGREAHYDHDAAEHGQYLPGLLCRVF